MIILRKALSTSFIFLVDKIYKLFEAARRECSQRKCLLCDEPFFNHSAGKQHDLCPACEADLPYNSTCCSSCALPLPSPIAQPPANLVCGECLKNAPPFDKTLAPLRYDFPVNKAIQQAKYRGKRYHLNFLTDLLAHEIVSRKDFPLPEAIIPVPLHKSRLKERGFNQTDVISKRLGRQLSIPVDRKVLRKINPTDSQTKLQKAQRKRNLKNAFQVSPAIHRNLAYRHVAMVDDVMTTGATAEVLAQILKENGVETVEIWSLARTPKQQGG